MVAAGPALTSAGVQPRHVHHSRATPTHSGVAPPRYRTTGISTKDMTYLFLCITLGMLNAVAPADFVSLSILSVIMLGLIFLLESKWVVKKEQINTIVYDNVQLIQAGRETELLADLQKRTGLSIHRYEVNEIDFLKDTCVLTVYFN
jgi:hypothetical protein